MSTDILPKNMGDDVAEVHQDPLGVPCTFDAARFGSGAREDAVDVIGDGAGLAIRIGRADDQVIGNGGQRRNLEEDDVGGFLVKHPPCNGDGRGSSCSCDRGPLGRDDAGVYKIPLGAATDLRPGVLVWYARECPMRRSGREAV